MRFLLSMVVTALALAGAAPANAAWYEARSKHFVIYADQNPKTLNDFANRLERFDRAVRLARNMADPPVADGNRLTVFVMPTAAAVQALYGDKSGFIDGFYKGLATGPIAYVAHRTVSDAPEDFANILFFHEYSHHLMFQAIDRPLPEWYVEGFAEFMSTVRFEKEGAIGLGAPANHRAWSLLEGAPLPLETLFTVNSRALSNEQRDSFYARGWLLVHYLTFEKSRAGQLDRYADLFAKGTPSLDAARAAFGDLGQLDRDLKSYMMRSRLNYLQLKGDALRPGPIEIQPMTEGASKVVLLRATLKNGVSDAAAEPLASQIRAVEAHYPGDELVEATLAEAEIEAGHAEAAEAAADRAIKADPAKAEPFVLKGRAMMALAEKMEGEQRQALFEEARSKFIAANKLDTEDPEPLMDYYYSYARAGVRPTDNAIAALHYASDLAPQDLGLRMNSAIAYINEGKPKEARAALVPVAYDPHGESIADVARRVIAGIDKGDAQKALLDAFSSARQQAPSH